MKLIFASSNVNKIREIEAVLPQNIILSGLKEIGITHEIPEPGTTIKENSFLKARFVWDFLKNDTNVSVFADDSGLEVEALNGAPGVYSARYAGEPKNDEANNIKLIQELKNSNNRNAHFITVITLILKGEVYYFQGEIKGSIALRPSGNSGFGYDPLFVPNGYTKTFAELGSEIKNSISHRAIAVKKMKEFLAGL